MLFGNPDQFAIEYVHEPTLDAPPAWRYGRVCFHVGGTRIGDFGCVETLNAVSAGWKELLKFAGKRFDPELSSYSASEAFTRLRKALWIGESGTHEDARRDWERYGRFRAIDHGTEAFQRWDAYLIEGGSGGRYIWSFEPDSRNEVHEHLIPAGDFDRILATAIDSIDQVTR